MIAPFSLRRLVKVASCQFGPIIADMSKFYLHTFIDIAQTCLFDDSVHKRKAPCGRLHAQPWVRVDIVFDQQRDPVKWPHYSLRLVSHRSSGKSLLKQDHTATMRLAPASRCSSSPRAISTSCSLGPVSITACSSSPW
jgi:hypothetical protein